MDTGPLLRVRKPIWVDSLDRNDRSRQCEQNAAEPDARRELFMES